MLQMESMRLVNSTLVRIKDEIERGEVEDAEELYKLSQEASLAVLDIQIKLDLKTPKSEVKNDENNKK